MMWHCYDYCDCGGVIIIVIISVIIIIVVRIVVWYGIIIHLDGEERDTVVRAPCGRGEEVSAAILRGYDAPRLRTRLLLFFQPPPAVPCICTTPISLIHAIATGLAYLAGDVAVCAGGAGAGGTACCKGRNCHR